MDAPPDLQPAGFEAGVAEPLLEALGRATLAAKEPACGRLEVREQEAAVRFEDAASLGQSGALVVVGDVVVRERRQDAVERAVGKRERFRPRRLESGTMVTSIELTEQELAELKELTNQTDAVEAVRAAMHDYIRYARRMRLKQLSGRVEMNDNWRQLEQAELNGESQSDRSHID